MLEALFSRSSLVLRLVQGLTLSSVSKNIYSSSDDYIGLAMWSACPMDALPDFSWPWPGLRPPACWLEMAPWTPATTLDRRSALRPQALGVPPFMADRLVQDRGRWRALVKAVAATLASHRHAFNSSLSQVSKKNNSKSIKTFVPAEIILFCPGRMKLFKICINSLQSGIMSFSEASLFEDLYSRFTEPTITHGWCQKPFRHHPPL